MSEPVVTFTIRELLTKIEDRLTALEQQVRALDATAAAAVVTATAKAARPVRRVAVLAAVSPLVSVGLSWWIARR